MKTIIILSGVKYQSLKQRPQHMAVFFASKGFRVVYTSLLEEKEVLEQTVFDSISTDKLFNLYAEKNIDNVFVLKRVLNSKGKDDAGLDELLEKLEVYFTPEKVTFLVAFPDWVKYLNRISKKSKIIYDCIDEWESFVNDLDFGLQNELIHDERKLACRANLITASARSLYLKMANFNDNIYYLPNGVFNADYENGIIAGRPKDMEGISGPIVFFMGAIAGWVDVELIEFLAKNRPEYSFVFIGSMAGETLPCLPNVHYLGKKKYDELPLYLGQARVAIIPFKVNKLTAAVTPLKFYEFLSSMTPVVTTMMPDLLDLKGSKVAKDSKQFLKYVDEIVNMEDTRYEKLKKDALLTSVDYDWGTLLEPLCRYIDCDEKINISTSEFAENTIQIYEKYGENLVVKNELLYFYNFLGAYDKSLTVISNNIETNLAGFELDYAQIALAQYNNNNCKAAKSFLSKYLDVNKRYSPLKKYFTSLIDLNNDLLIAVLILKICGNPIAAIRKIEEINDINNPIVLGLLAGLYMDLGEYQVAIYYATEALNNGNFNINMLLDMDVMVMLIDTCKKEENFELAEELALMLLNNDKETEERVHKILGDIYLSKYSRIQN